MPVYLISCGSTHNYCKSIKRLIKRFYSNIDVKIIINGNNGIETNVENIQGISKNINNSVIILPVTNQLFPSYTHDEIPKQVHMIQSNVHDEFQDDSRVYTFNTSISSNGAKVKDIINRILKNQD